MKDFIKRYKKEFVDKSNNSRFIYDFDLYKKIATLAIKAELKAEQDKIVKIQVFDSTFLCGKIYFEGDGTENCLVFQPVHRYLKKNYK